MNKQESNAFNCFREEFEKKFLSKPQVFLTSSHFFIFEPRRCTIVNHVGKNGMTEHNLNIIKHALNVSRSFIYHYHRITNRSIPVRLADLVSSSFLSNTNAVSCIRRYRFPQKNQQHSHHYSRKKGS